ncbi:uncharacterized protein LOC110440908, partial [Mizuhopecten yessoensis]|uniref:uncharacterized protein LOC110440908 n=1 Tax=Mizuhopecten yessoensis TaxID=6573 RepID=UPI000B45F813
YDHFEDILTNEEEEEITRELRIKQAAFAEIAARDAELIKIRDAQLPAKKKPRQTPETKEDGFKNYMKMYYDRPRLAIPEDEIFPEDKIKAILKGPAEKGKLSPLMLQRFKCVQTVVVMHGDINLFASV